MEICRQSGRDKERERGRDRERERERESAGERWNREQYTDEIYINSFELEIYG